MKMIMNLNPVKRQKVKFSFSVFLLHRNNVLNLFRIMEEYQNAQMKHIIIMYLPVRSDAIWGCPIHCTASS